MYSYADVELEIIKFLRFPIPRSPLDIVRHLRENVMDFYPKSRPDLVVPFVKRNFLDELVKKGLLVQYFYNDISWKNARRLLTHYYQKNGKPAPRKVSTLYQVNFFYLVDEPIFYNFQAIKDINVDFVAFLYRFVHGKHISNFAWNLLNLLLCHASVGADRDAVRLAVYASDAGFSQEERDLLERFLELSGDERVKPLLASLPFKPDLDKAVSFLKSFGGVVENEKQE